jgi:hydrogenase maturation protein HypF
VNAQLRRPPKRAESRLTARRLRLAGHVQGVGFRPFVHRLAGEHALSGSVRNRGGEVEIFVQGRPEGIERFLHDLLDRAPPLARPHMIECLETTPSACPPHDFVILDSAEDASARVFVPPDSFTCDACLAELSNAADRRYRYPFINCTQCGPRYTLIESLPYDRSRTTMASFQLCPNCAREYATPADRRFHAEPLACPVCGPGVWLERSVASEPGESTVMNFGTHHAAPSGNRSGGEPIRREEPLREAVELLRRGGILAVRGIGGYHLLCDARSDAAVERLRTRKRRPAKPLAVMFPQSGPAPLERVRREVALSAEEAQLLLSPARPIVLARKRTDTTLADSIAPGLGEIGVFLPYSPLHHLLLADFDGPVVATSGNVSGEPVITAVDAARTSLAPVADASLHHDRPIARPADDSVVRHALGRARTVRAGRGLAPCELELPWALERPVIATGGHLKATIALAWGRRAVISPHIGDLYTARAQRVFAQVAEDLQRLYGVRAAEVVCDGHPDYASTRWAESSGLPVTRVWHHAAHASALAGEHDPNDPMVVFAWDGVGLGSDRTLWGGETFLGAPGRWRRVASFRTFKLPGGERAGRAPWRSAAALCWELGRDPPKMRIDPLVYDAWRGGLNSPQTSSVGRLFDAASALLLGLRETSFEGQGPMLLEAAASAPVAAIECAPLPRQVDAEGVLRVDWEPLIAPLAQAGGEGGPNARQRLARTAAEFHATLAATIGAVAEDLRCASGIGRVGLTGGVFQNVLLTELAHELLERQGFEVLLAEHVPCNDGGLSYGQIIELAGARGGEGTSIAQA